MYLHKFASFPCFILFLNLQTSASRGQALSESNDEWISSLVTNFGVEINENIVKKSTGIEKLKEFYTDLNPPIRNVDTDGLLSQKILKVRKIFQTAEYAVEELSDEAEKSNLQTNRSATLTGDLVSFYGKDENHTSSNMEDIFTKSGSKMFYYNAKCGCVHQLPSGVNESECVMPPGGFSSSKHFNNERVSFSSSAVHIPVDVYNEGSQILRDIAWSQGMDPLFLDQLCNSSMNDVNLRWMYVATRHGMLRYFPSRHWNVPCEKVDLHDSRGDAWFVQSMSSPKDVIIMVDNSGSIIGLTLNLIKLSIKHIMSSLTENDFFNLFVFNANASFLNPSCKGLMQASPINKQMAVSWLDNIEVGNSSSFDTGFEFAFKVLSEGNTRASCNPIILLLTDGGVEYPNSVLSDMNRGKKNTTRVFTYSVGKHFSSTTSLKDMACDNRGQFVTIPSDSATHFQTMKYLDKISNPLAYSDQRPKKWTLPYEDRLGLGTVMSVSRPIFERYIPQTDEHKHISRVIGVAGVDILHEDIKQVLNTSQFGSLSYMFGVENNGFLFYHPQLKKGRLNSPLAIDVSDIEHMDMSEIRECMINKKTGSNTLNRIISSLDGKHLSNVLYRYSFAPLQNSLFSIGLAIPVSNLYSIDATQALESVGNSRDIGSIVINHEDLYSAAYGYQCKPRNDTTRCDVHSATNSQSMSDNVTLEYVVGMSSCTESGIDIEQLSELHLHGLITHDLSRYWISSDTRDIVEAVFVATDTKPSLLRIKYNRMQENREEIQSYFADPQSKDYFQRALTSATTIYTLLSFNINVPTIETTQSSTTTPLTTTQAEETTLFDDISTAWPDMTDEPQVVSYIVASKAVVLSTSPQVTPAVSGALLSYDDFKMILFNMSATQCTNGASCTQAHDCRNKDRTCLILDDGGILMISNQDSTEAKIDEFFGTNDGDLMSALVRDDFYSSVDIKDHQVVCESTDSKDNAAPRNFIIPTITNILNIGMWVMTGSWFMVRNVVYIIGALGSEAWGMMYGNITVSPFNSSEYVTLNDNVGKNHCILNKTVFSFSSQRGPLHNYTDCNRTYTANRIPNTNLLFVVADNFAYNCSVERGPYPSQLYKDTTDKISASSVRYRRKPNEKCFDTGTFLSELDTDCGASQLTLPSAMFMIIQSYCVVLLLGIFR